jgi:hypothetical protein
MISKQLFNVRLALMVLASCAWVISSLDSLWSLSVDLAHHYALVVRLTELWAVPYSGDPSLGEMNYYPRLSHIVAALLGRFLGSAVLGIQGITLIAIVVLWGSLVAIALSLPAKARLTVALGLCTLLWVNRQYFHFDMHAGEVVTNFFYAQLVAQSFIVFMIAMSFYLERINFSHYLLRYAMLGGAVYVAAAIHLLPALELLFFLAGLMAIELFDRVRTGHISGVKAALTYLWVPAVATAVYLHPSMAIMSSFSNNNGEISGPLQSVNVLIGYSLVHLLGSIYVLYLWFFMSPPQIARQWLALKYFGIYGIAVAGLCVMQVLALKLGYGSEYAVKKYIFALNTTACLEIAMLLAWVTCRRMADETLASSTNLSRALAYVLAPTLLLASLYAVTPSKPTIQTNTLFQLEQQLLMWRNQQLPRVAGKYDYLDGFSKISPVIDYMMSIGVLKAPRVTTKLATPGGWNWNIVGTLITTENSALDQVAACRRTAPVGSLVMIDGACMAQHHPHQHIVGFTSNHPPTPCVTDGFSVAEEFGTWTSAVSASLRCPRPKGQAFAPQVVEIDAAAFLINLPSQRLTVSIEGQPPVNYLFDAAHPQQLIVLKLPPVATQEIKINFRLPDAKSPQEIGLSKDMRTLGLSLRTLEFK